MILLKLNGSSGCKYGRITVFVFKFLSEKRVSLPLRFSLLFTRRKVENFYKMLALEWPFLIVPCMFHINSIPDCGVEKPPETKPAQNNQMFSGSGQSLQARSPSSQPHLSGR